MRICFLADYNHIHTFRWLKYFASRHEIHLIALEPTDGDSVGAKPENYEEIGIKLHIIPRVGSINKLRAASRVKKLLKEIIPDLIHAHYISHYGYLAATSGFHPVVMTAWGTDVLIEPEESFLKRRQVKYALRRTDAVTCDGENTADALSKYIDDPNKIKKIYFGVDTKKVSPDKKIEGFYSKYLKDKTGKTVINIRGFAEIYDPDTFIKAIPAVLQRYPGTIFLMAREGERRKKYEEMVTSIGIKDSVIFLGRIPTDELPTYLASADVYVSPSLSDSGISASTAEAMASGIAVISTDVGDISYWIENGKNGFIIPKSDSNALSERIIYLLSNDEVRKSIGREARKTIEKNQDYYVEMGKVEQLYESLVKEARK